MKQWYFNPTVVGIALAAALYILSLVFDLDLANRLGGVLGSMEHLELDEFLLAGVAFAFFEYRNHAQRKQRSVYGATAGAAQHVLGNLLQGLQRLEVAFRESRGIPLDVLELYEPLTTEARAQLKALSEVEKIDARSIWQAVAPERQEPK